MALTTTEEAQLRQLLDQQSQLLTLASQQATISSKLSATKKNLSQLDAATSVSGTDISFLRQGGADKSVLLSLLSDYIVSNVPGVADASTTAKGIIEIATNGECIAGVDTTRSVTPNGLAAYCPVATSGTAGKVELATGTETLDGVSSSLAVTPSALSFNLARNGFRFPTLGVIGITSNTTLTTDQINRAIEIQNPNLTVTMPSHTSVAVGSTFTFKCFHEVTFQSSNIFRGRASSSTTTVVSGNRTISFVANSNGWYAVAEGQSDAVRQLTTSGFITLDGNVKIMWGQATSSGTTANNAVVTLPTSLNSVLYGAFATVLGNSANNYTIQRSSSNLSTITFTVTGGNTAAYIGGVGFYYLAIGV